MEHFVHYSEQSHKWKQIDIISHRSDIDCIRVIQNNLPFIVIIVRLSTITFPFL